MRLEPLQLWFQPQPGPLLPQLRPSLLARAQAQAGPEAQLLRWAITATEAERGLWIEAVLLVGDLVGQPAGQRLGQPALAVGTQAPGVPAPGNAAIRHAAPGTTCDRPTTASQGS